MDNAMRNILDAAREYGFFVDRGDPAAVDFTSANFTKDNAWHELNLSSIIPEHAHGIVFSLTVQANAIAKLVTFREPGNAHAQNASKARTIVANMRHQLDCVCVISADRKIEYRAAVAIYEYLEFTVKGWWF